MEEQFPRVVEEVSEWSEAAPMDKPVLLRDLKDIFNIYCEQDGEALRTLVSQLGGADELAKLYAISGKNCKLIDDLNLILNEVCDFELGRLRTLRDAVGGADTLVALYAERGGKYLRQFLMEFKEKDLKHFDPELLDQEDLFEQHHTEVLQEFASKPSEEGVKALCRLALLRHGEVLKIRDGKKQGEFFVLLSVSGPLEGQWAVWSRCSGVLETSVKVAEVSLAPLPAITSSFPTLGGKYVAIKSAGLMDKLANSQLIWIAWCDYKSLDLKFRTKDVLSKVTFNELRNLALKLAGPIEAYQAKCDLRESAKYKETGRMCFSFSCPLGGELSGVWVLHVHCVETNVSEEGQCLAFEPLSASLKLLSEDRETESPNTMKLNPEDLPKKSKGHGSERQALKLYLEQREPVMKLIEKCDRHKVLREWNECKLLLTTKAAHATIYDRHNVAGPSEDLEGWAASLKRDRIRFLFFSKKGLEGHLDELQGEISRLVKLASEASGNTLREKLEKVAHELMQALEKSAKVSTKNAAVRGQDWEDFAFEINVDFGEFGTFRLVRKENGEVSSFTY